MAAVGTSCHYWWTRDIIGQKSWVVDVDEDARIGALVKISAQRARDEAIAAGSRDFDVHALRVILSAIGVIRRM